MSIALNICLSCGLCCDGTIIGFVQLNTNELSKLRGVLNIEEVETTGVFFQPCNNFSCNGCNIYAQRPKQCHNFKCGLLKSIEKKELAFDMALEVINLIKQKKVIIEKQLVTSNSKLKAQSFYFRILEFKKLLSDKNNDASLAQNQNELISNIEEINDLMAKNFDLSL